MIVTHIMHTTYRLNCIQNMSRLHALSYCKVETSTSWLL